MEYSAAQLLKRVLENGWLIGTVEALYDSKALSPSHRQVAHEAFRALLNLVWVTERLRAGKRRATGGLWKARKALSPRPSLGFPLLPQARLRRQKGPARSAYKKRDRQIVANSFPYLLLWLFAYPHLLTESRFSAGCRARSDSLHATPEDHPVPSYHYRPRRPSGKAGAPRPIQQHPMGYLASSLGGETAAHLRWSFDASKCGGVRCRPNREDRPEQDASQFPFGEVISLASVLRAGRGGGLPAERSRPRCAASSPDWLAGRTIPLSGSRPLRARTRRVGRLRGDRSLSRRA